MLILGIVMRRAATNIVTVNDFPIFRADRIMTSCCDFSGNIEFLLYSLLVCVKVGAVDVWEHGDNHCIVESLL